MTAPVAIDYGLVLQTAIITRLRATITGAAVWQHVPAKTPLPVVLLGDMSAQDAGVKGAVRDNWSIMIHCVTKGSGNAACLALQAQVRAALDRWKPADASSVQIKMLAQVSADMRLLPDDEIYFGSQTFTTATNPA